MKTCTLCGEEKPLDEFHRRAASKDGHRSGCKPCDQARGVAYRVAHPDGWSRVQRRNNLRYRYGITPEDFDRMLAEQDGCCAICKTDSPGGNGNFHVDHDHETGAVCGLLCHNCNRAIGMLGHSVRTLISAIYYLLRTRMSRG